MKILQLPNIGNGGRLGNQIFAIASTIGLALRHGYTPRFPSDWKYRKYFNIPDEWFGEILSDGFRRVESCFEYDEKIGRFLDGNSHMINLYGYLQCPKYWAGFEGEIKRYLTPKGAEPGSVPKVAIHYRRGDYLNNPNYKQLSVDYTAGIYSEYFYPAPIQAFSDNYEFIRLHHEGDILPKGDEMQDFINMINCRFHIISNSTFAWWAAYLSNGFTVYPPVWFDGKLSERCSTKTLFPEGWQQGEIKKANLSDVTFIIPVSFDHIDRLHNLATVIAYLKTNFHTNIIVGEINSKCFSKIPADYMHFDFGGQFHRTKALNEMTKAANTPYVVNYDADVLIPPFQLLKMADMLRSGTDVVYPYDGRFCMVERSHLPNMGNDLSGFAGKQFPKVGASREDRNSYGGCVGFNKVSYLGIGGENENFVSMGAEDQERWRRCNMLLTVERVPGQLFHMNHYRGTNSTFRHDYGTRNQYYWKQICAMTDDQFIEHIKTFTWLR
jgi:hypothetical protein